MKLAGFTLFLLSLLPTPALAQPGPTPGEDPIGSRLYPPELIMSHQSDLGIDEKQRSAILKELEKAQPKLMAAQWEMQEQVQLLAKALSSSKVDEAKALAQADKVIDLERDVKRAHLGMLIRIRNVLTDTQRAKLDELRGSGSSPGGETTFRSGALVVTSTPGGAQIYIDGGDSTRVTPVTPANPIPLPPGNHQVELRLSGKVVSTHTVAIKPGETTILRRDLAP